MLVQSGDLWACGPHRILCGDSTNFHVIQALHAVMPVTATAVITDPPYGEIQASWDHATTAFIPYLRDLVNANAHIAIFATLPYGFVVHEVMRDNGWRFRNDFIWTKANGGMKVSKWLPRNAHESIHVYARGGVMPSALIFNGYEAGEPGQPWGDNCTSDRGVHRGVYNFDLAPNRQGRADGKRWIRSLLQGRVKQALPMAERTLHPTQKPIELITKLVLLYSYPGNLILDLFLGSGTTFLACETVGRVCYAVEQSPDYCQMAMERWQQQTGISPYLLTAHLAAA